MKIFTSLFSLLLIISAQLVGQEQLPVNQSAYFSKDNRLYINKKLGLYVWLSVSPEEDSPKVRLVSDSSDRYSNPMYFDTEGYNTFRSPSAVDTSSRKTIYPLQDIIFEVYSDGMAPSSKIKFSKAAGYTKSNVVFYGNQLRITFSATDANSGVAGTFYSLANEKFIAYADSLKDFKEGENILQYYSTDHVGNREEVRIANFIIDTKPPVLSFEAEGKTNKAAGSAAKLKLIAQDELSGTKTIYYRIAPNKNLVYSGALSLKILEKEGTTLTFWAVDNLGNTSAEKTISNSDVFSN